MTGTADNVAAPYISPPSITQRSLSIHGTVYKQFNVQHHLISRRTLRAFRAEAMDPWRHAVGIA